MKHIIFILSTLLLFSCKPGGKRVSMNHSEIEDIKIDLKNGIIYPLDSLFSSSGQVDFVKLETTDDNLIGGVSDIFFDDSLIFVVDANKTKSIFMFDMTGKYLSKIANYGNGPGEYTTMYNVFLSKNKKEIVVIDTPQHKQIHYAYSGKFLAEERMPPSINCIFLESGNKAYYIGNNSNPPLNTSDNNNVLVVTNENNKIIYTACTEFENENFGLNEPKDFWKYDNEVFFYPNFQDTLFLITDTVAIAKYYIDILPHKMPHPGDINNITTDEFLEKYLNRYVHFGCEFVELKDVTYLELDGDVEYGYRILYSHKTKKTYLCSSGSEINSIYHFFTTPIARYEDNTVVTSVFPYRLIEGKKHMYDVPKLIENFGFHMIETDKNYLDSLYHDLNEEDNPVLFFYELNTNL